ncbi:putative trehalose-phosphatase [Cucumispora dikerogammari]|nr:putative trehalose-phosphatase [Cucumispora dikerogammari]
MPENLSNFRLQIKETLYKQGKPLLVFDYDGTLNSINIKDYSLMTPTKRIKSLIKELSKTSDIVIATGRNVEEIESFFPERELILYAEHGAHRRINGTWKIKRPNIIREWVDKVKNLIDTEKQITLEVQKASLNIHCPTMHNETVYNALKEMFENDNVRVTKYRGFVNVRFRKNNKGVVLLDNASRKTILCAGDGMTDEDMFIKCSNMPTWITVHIGAGKTEAKYRCDDVEELILFLEFLLE